MEKKIIELKDIKEMRGHVLDLFIYFYVAKDDESIRCELGDGKLGTKVITE